MDWGNNIHFCLHMHKLLPYVGIGRQQNMHTGTLQSAEAGDIICLSFSPKREFQGWITTLAQKKLTPGRG